MEVFGRRSPPRRHLSPPMHRVSNGSVASGDSRRSSMVDSSGRFCSQPTNGAPEVRNAKFRYSSFGNELWRQKTELVKGSSEPHYNYSLHRTNLDICTVRIEVWSSVGVLRRRQMLGWLAMGLNSSSPDAQEHWQQMIQVSYGSTRESWL
uniref:C2 domain-containing protein n=1 Tax=Angiostrongylus cantonensis TaxID=6313 RepID=A0A0K0DI14_ANGCA